MAVRPKGLADDYLPGLGEQYEVGLVNVGVSVVVATIAVNTSQTDAELIASPPNTAAVGAAHGPIVHSLGVAPTAVFMQPQVTGGDIAANIDAGSPWATQFAFMTANASAVFFRARTWTGAVLRGVAARMTAIR